MNLLVESVICREDLYPRFKPNPQVIQTYSENIDKLPPIEINQDNILIDGYHRWKAHQSAGKESIACTVTETKSEMQLQMLAVERNSKHGQQLTSEEKRAYVNEFFDQLDREAICNALSISKRTYDSWTQSKREAKEEQRNRTILEMYMACHTQQEIANAVDLPQQTVADKIADITDSSKYADSGNFRNFSPELYTIWNFGKATNEVRHFGNIPPEIIDSL